MGQLYEILKDTVKFFSPKRSYMFYKGMGATAMIVGIIDNSTDYFLAGAILYGLGEAGLYARTSELERRVEQLETNQKDFLPKP
ncbi:MAG: hypothetical protein ABIJ18_04245 [archaeon]